MVYDRRKSVHEYQHVVLSRLPLYPRLLRAGRSERLQPLICGHHIHLDMQVRQALAVGALLLWQNRDSLDCGFIIQLHDSPLQSCLHIIQVAILALGGKQDLNSFSMYQVQVIMHAFVRMPAGRKHCQSFGCFVCKLLPCAGARCRIELFATRACLPCPT